MKNFDQIRTEMANILKVFEKGVLSDLVPDCHIYNFSQLQFNLTGSSIVTPIVGQISDEFSLENLQVNKTEVEEPFVASFRHLSDPKITGYTQFRIKGTPGDNLIKYLSL